MAFPRRWQRSCVTEWKRKLGWQACTWKSGFMKLPEQLVQWLSGRRVVLVGLDFEIKDVVRDNLRD